MSKYDQFWRWMSGNGMDSLKLIYSEAEEIVSLPIDHSFLSLKEGLLGYGYRIDKISMKEETVAFEKVKI